MNSYIDKNGYRRDAVTNKLIHRVIAEELVGRKLKWYERVHHINGNKLDNDPTNLEILHYKTHTAIHRYQRRISGVW
jgi:hypothetical protein